MTAAALELQKAIVATLKADAALTEALGGGRIYDHAPANAAFPYVTIGRTSIHDWSTATENGSEHLLTLHFWSKGKGKKEAFELMDAACALLQDARLPLEGHQLVNLTRDYAEVRYDDDLDLHHGLLRFRAMIERTA